MTIKADVTQVQIGFLSIEGLMSENGDFGVAVPQLANIDFVPPNRSVKQLKALLGEDFDFEKWLTPLNAKPVNVIRTHDLERLVLLLAQKGNPEAIEAWNTANPSRMFAVPTKAKPPERIESKVESRIYALYLDWNPKRQIQTDFGIADIVHDYGVVEIKEFKSVSSAHKAIGQAMSYGAILKKQPEVVLFNVPEKEVQRVLRIFTAIGMLVLLYTKEGTKKLLSRKILHPEHTNIHEIELQISHR